MKYVYKHDIARFKQFAVRVMNVEQNHFNDEETALMGIATLEAFFDTIGMPTRLSHVEIDDKHLEELADKAVQFGDLGTC